MLIRRYFVFLVFGSVVCFVFLAFFDSSTWRRVSFTQPSKILRRYTKHIGDFLNSNDDGFSRITDDVLLRESEDQLYYIQELVQKLVLVNRTKPISTDLTTKVINSVVGQQDICSPNENIVFLKTHKTGSSTLTNILNRYADLRDLKVAIPVAEFNRFRWPLQFHWTYVNMFLLNNEYANILCNHARYNRPSMDAIMEQDSKYITILRNPIFQFESMFDYMEFSRDFRLNMYPDPMRRFLRRPFLYIRNLTVNGRPFPESMHLIRNGQFFDLGLDPTYYDNRTRVLQEIAKLDKEFFLVLIMEYFDESLVLLKREMCWKMEDIVYAKMNQRHREKKERLDDSLKQMIKRWNGADVLLYRHFNRTFWKKIKMHGEEFYKDLKEFRQKNSEVQKSCISPIKTKEKAFRLTKEVTKLQINPDVSNFDKYFCEKILTDEVAYLKYFRLKYNPHFGYQRKPQIHNALPKTTPMPTRTLPTARKTWTRSPRNGDGSEESYQRSRGTPSIVHDKPRFVDIVPRTRL